MAGLTIKYPDAKVTVANRNFDQAAFTDEAGAWVYIEDKFKPILKEMKTELGNIAEAYDQIAAKYKHMFEHGDSDGGKLDKNDGFYARIKKYKDKSAARADISRSRKTSLANTVDDVDAQTKNYGTVSEEELNAATAIDNVDGTEN